MKRAQSMCAATQNAQQAVEAARRAVPEPVVEMCERLHRSGHGAWVVGGCLRDVLLGRAPTDWDIATTAEPQQVMKIFRRVIPTGIQHGTVMVRHRGRSYEVTTLRGEGTYSDARRPDEVFFVSDITQDLARRDFTVNAMAFDPLTCTLVDVFGGLSDLAAGVLRTVGDPLARFREDGLRVLRAARFVSTLELRLDPDTEVAIRPSLDAYRKVSHERVREEWVKALGARRPSRAFEVMERTGILAETCDLLRALADAERETGAAWWTASLHGMDAVSGDPVLRLAALLRLTVRGPHGPQGPAAIAEASGAALARLEAWLRDYRFSNAERERVLHLVRHWASALAPFDEDGAVRHWLHRVGPSHAQDLLALARAHVTSLAGPEADGAALDSLAERVARVIASGAPLATRDLAISGRDLITHSGIPPGPEVGRTLEALLARVLEDPSLNERDRLLELVGEPRRDPR